MSEAKEENPHTEENTSLTNDILECIQNMLAMPKMYAGTAEGLEGQFFNMCVLVAPYAFDMTSHEAAVKITDFAHTITGTNLGMSSTLETEDVEGMAHILRRCYSENFETAPKSEVIH